jgi:hypothetical protein
MILILIHILSGGGYTDNGNGIGSGSGSGSHE